MIRPDGEALLARLRAGGCAPPAGASVTVEWFGNSPGLIRELGELVRNGFRRASAGLAAEYFDPDLPAARAAARCDSVDLPAFPFVTRGGGR